MIQQHLTSSGLNDTFNRSHLGFEAEREQLRQILRQARVDIDENNVETIIEANLPFEYRPKTTQSPQRGILLIHGLLESPYSMRYLAAHFRDQGFWVRTLLLPGHGTRSGDLLNVHYQAWLDAGLHALTDLQKHVDEMFCLGHSTGANIALYHAQQGFPLAGLFLSAPALKILSPFAPLARCHKALSWAIPRAAWFTVQPDQDYTKYESMALNAVQQVHELGLRVCQAQQAIRCPMFMWLTDADRVIDSRYAQRFFATQTHPRNRLLIYSSQQTSHTLGHTEWIASALPEQSITELSHVSLNMSPDDPHYGQQGDYTHLLETRARQAGHKPPFRYGEPNPFNFLGSHLRLYYNPLLPKLFDGIDDFLDA